MTNHANNIKHWLQEIMKEKYFLISIYIYIHIWDNQPVMTNSENVMAVIPEEHAAFKDLDLSDLSLLHKQITLCVEWLHHIWLIK